MFILVLSFTFFDTSSNISYFSISKRVGKWFFVASYIVTDKIKLTERDVDD